MPARVVIGKRGGDYGIWASPPGVDALTAADSQLTLAMSGAADQMILRGVAAPPSLVALGLNQRPFVLLTNINFNPQIGFEGFMSPFPHSEAVAYNCFATLDGGAAMLITGNAPLCGYAVFRRVF